MSACLYDEKPWLAQYTQGLSSELNVPYATIVEAFAAVCEKHATATILQYFDGAVSVTELNEWAKALALTLSEQGIAKGDRVGLYMQNNPAFIIALLATWQLGAIAVPINPMNKAAELSYVLNNSGARALVCLDSLYQEVVAPLLNQGQIPTKVFVTCSALDGQTSQPPVLFAGQQRLATAPGVFDLQEIIDNAGTITAQQPLPTVSLAANDIALLSYTSGTTGKPKGAMNTHGNVMFNACVFQAWSQVTEADINFAIAPMFHITGMVAHAALTLLTGNTLVLMHRFQPSVALELIREFRPTITTGAITAFISLMNTGEIQSGDFSSFTAVLSGGAPISPTANEEFYRLTGQYIHNAYGMTETCSITLGVPVGKTAPVDQATSALSIGVPVPNTQVRVLGENGQAVTAGEVGELAVKGPQNMVGYWLQDEATKEAFSEGYLLTGDVGFMDDDGWFYLVDRKKDMINAGGYKVWPREVEDVMYTHPAIREVAIVGVPDGYRGETVKAVVSLKKGASATAEELIAFGKENMSSYKYPRIVEFMDELPKTNTGKILRRSVR